ncbi:protealysin inhibitor emfourin [Solirubrobacter soli]|uniref:protealysin inhibitor emfourin n=1 Tax=Solirubrobacter soli TaxID=363832 RepID=UPI00042477AB|nr:protealysin inhibitor emfourin [Solirubrobacter soli]
MPRLTLRQSGGFAGIEHEPVRLEVDRLDPTVRELLATPPPEVAGADLPRYELTVEDGDERHTVAWHDDGSEAVAPLRALADEVTRQAGS